MVDIALDLRLQGNLDLRVAGWISLLGNEEDRRRALGDDYGTAPHRDRRRSLETSESSGAATQRTSEQRISEEAAQLIEGNDDTTRSSSGSALARAALETREAIKEVKDAMESKDAQRMRQARERLKEAARDLAEARRRGKEEIADAEFAEST
jgi:hypothetical protein